MEKVFEYRAFDRNGRVVEGSIEAQERANVLEFLTENNLKPVSVDEKVVKLSEVEIKVFEKKSVSLKELSAFCRQMATMLSAGISLSRAISVLYGQTESKFFKESLQLISDKVKQGTPLSKAMAEQPNVYPEILVSMVEAGEMNGKQDEAFDNMALHFEKEHKINQKVKGAMIYPAVLTAVMLVVTIIVMVGVVPMFVEMFESANAELPGPTKALMAISDSLKRFWYLYAAGIAAVVLGSKKYLNSASGKYSFDKFKLQGPGIISKPMKQIVTARFTRTASTLLSSGISIIEAVSSAAATTSNTFVTEKMNEVVQGMKQGKGLAEELEKITLFPTLMVSMVSIGEETGAVDDLMLRTADFYEEEMNAAIGRLLALLEPLLIVIMAIVMGFILVALMVPMLTMGAL